MNLNFQGIERVISLLADKNVRITLISHINPDGDALGSVLGLYHFLLNNGFTNVKSILPSGYPSFLAWMPGADNILIADTPDNQSLSEQIIEQTEIIFCLDFNDLARTASLESSMRGAKGLKVLIDHHPEPKSHFDIIYSVIDVSSTSELIYLFIKALYPKNRIDKKIADCLYAGIVTDTGSFSYSCNFASTYNIVAEYIELGVDGEKIHRLIYDTYSENRMRLLGFCLSERLRVLHDCKTAFIYLSVDDLLRFNHEDGDTEGVVNYALSIKGICLAAIFIEKEDRIKISFRSEGSLSVNYLARNFYSGGGHKNASGGHSHNSLQHTIAHFEKLIKDLSANDFVLLRDVQDIL